MEMVGKEGDRAAQLLGSARRIVLKVGSSLLVDNVRGGLRSDWLATLGTDIAQVRAQGRQVCVVSSGSVALGRAHLGLKRSPRLASKQAAAAAGQPLLMQAWERALAPFAIPTAQLLLTLDDTESRQRWLNARATMEILLAQGALPVVNENDTVATEELRYGDNDRLSARVAQMIRADILVLLSDVDGLYTADPGRDPGARHVPSIAAITSEVEGWAGPASGSGIGSGGMRTKIAAARIAQASGCATIIAKGHEPHPVARMVSGSARTSVIEASSSPGRAYKQWIAGTLRPAGSVTIDEGAVSALAAGRSLLPSGVLEVDGSFERGVCLRVLAPDGREVARGLVAYNALEARSILGCASSEIEARLGYSGPDALIHRDDMVPM